MVSIFAYWPFVQLVEIVYSDRLPILKLDFLLLLGCKSYLFEIQVHFQICGSKFFSHSVDCLFIFLMMSFDAKSLTFDEVHSSFFIFFSVCCMGISLCLSTVCWKDYPFHWIASTLFFKVSWSCLWGFIFSLPVLFHWFLCLSSCQDPTVWLL